MHMHNTVNAIYYFENQKKINTSEEIYRQCNKLTADQILSVEISVILFAEFLE